MANPLRCQCGHGEAKHHLPVGPGPHPESADTYCECGSEDCWPGFVCAWVHLDEINERLTRAAKKGKKP